jgi:hypothetical protein
MVLVLSTAALGLPQAPLPCRCQSKYVGHIWSALDGTVPVGVKTGQVSQPTPFSTGCPGGLPKPDRGEDFRLNICYDEDVARQRTSLTTVLLRAAASPRAGEYMPAQTVLGVHRICSDL